MPFGALQALDDTRMALVTVLLWHLSYLSSWRGSDKTLGTMLDPAPVGGSAVGRGLGTCPAS
jgi:hypothetical protein